MEQKFVESRSLYQSIIIFHEEKIAYISSKNLIVRLDEDIQKFILCNTILCLENRYCIEVIALAMILKISSKDVIIYF